MSNLTKYPRTFHFPWSQKDSSDDVYLDEEDIKYFENKHIVVTEKLDGENTNMYRDHIHARSMDSRSHDSQNWIRQFHALIKNEIPEGWRFCGENVYAKHSIYYDRLTTFFYVFSIWNEKNECLSWQETCDICKLLNQGMDLKMPFALEPAPVLYEGSWDEKLVKACWTGQSVFGDEQEGYVCRIADSFPFPYPDKTSPKKAMPVFKDLAKYVRPNHVRTDSHWRNTWTPNKLAI